MDFKQIFSRDPEEKPLDIIKDDGGFTSIFRQIVVVGDSLASGELESMDVGCPRGYHDIFDISWGQYLARMSGTNVLNFSRGGMTASEYMNSWAAANGCWDKSKAGQAYIIALGCNDLDGLGQAVGSVGDINEDYHRNADTFCGHYAKIIQEYKRIQPDAVFFLVTMPREDESFPADIKARHDAHEQLMIDLANYFTNTYVIDLRKYGPAFDNEHRKLFWTGGHLNSAGYYIIAKMIGSYIDYIVRHNMEKFNQSGFIGTPWKYCE
ncbi:MAG: SGNH/GDSL hydrolase family protein [Clostridia bacterium]|nr:SGNH/GDSL hydrolase family protein [Clostridia bacterium]